MICTKCGAEYQSEAVHNMLCDAVRRVNIEHDTTRYKMRQLEEKVKTLEARLAYADEVVRRLTNIL